MESEEQADNLIRAQVALPILLAVILVVFNRHQPLMEIIRWLCFYFIVYLIVLLECAKSQYHR